MNLLKAHSHATGPVTEAGKARSAANLAGHPTPEEAQLTRFNALKTGTAARVATFWPAKPGRYAICEDCDHLIDQACVPWGGCLKRAELFMRFHLAFESGDHRPLQELMSTTHAGIHALIQEMILTIAKDGGPRLKQPEWFYDKDGGFHLAKYVDEETGEKVQLHKLQEHPLLKRLMEYIAKNHTTLQDMELTPKQQTEESMLKGHLEGQEQARENALAFQERQQRALEALESQIARSRERLFRDPVLIEHQQQDDG